METHIGLAEMRNDAGRKEIRRRVLGAGFRTAFFILSVGCGITKRWLQVSSIEEA